MSIKTEILKKLGLGSNQTPATPQDVPGSPPENVKHGTLNFKPTSERTRTGKVARLPLEARITVNTMLDDGEEYQAIVDKLSELGHPAFIVQNISRWKAGGYQTWIRDRQQSELAQIHADSALQLVREMKDATQLCEANAVLLASQTWRALLQFQSCPAEELIGERASKFAQLAKASTVQFAERTRRDLANSKIQSSPAARAKVEKPFTPPDRDQLHKLVVDIVDESIGISLPPEPPLPCARPEEPAATNENHTGPEPQTVTPPPAAPPPVAALAPINPSIHGGGMQSEASSLSLSSTSGGEGRGEEASLTAGASQPETSSEPSEKSVPSVPLVSSVPSGDAAQPILDRAEKT